MQNINQSNFIGALFDFSFSQFVSETLIRVLYLVAVGLAIIAAIVGVIAAFINYGLSMATISTLILAPIVILIYIVIVRVTFEFVIVIFRIADHTRQIAENTRFQSSEE